MGPTRSGLMTSAYIWTSEGKLYLAVILDFIPAVSLAGPLAIE